MNTSGKPIQRLLTGLRIPQQNLIILHDDLDLKSGHIRLKCGGSSGGQNGLNDTLNVLGHNSPFIRMRLGIGRPIHPNMDVPDFVLGKFSPPERENLKYIDQFALTAIAQTILYGHAKANEHLGNFRTSYDAMKKGVS
jgi:PTH1 family peptidyl-tRNA hydrolase